jgi:L-2-hydroxyglutarate oxidase LhgO
MEQIDVVVFGAGVVGLASALAIANNGHSVCVVERADRPGRGTSTRNSGVIHAGLYYPPGSLKATLCVRGRDLLFDFCERHHVPHERPGKLVVARDATDIPALEALERTAHANGVSDATIVDSTFIRAREPNARAVAALWSPSTGIIEPEAYVRALEHLLRDHDVPVLVGSPVLSARSNDGRIEVTTPHETIAAQVVVNAAGLYADQVSALIGGESFRIYPSRGEYAELAPGSRGLLNGLLYPVPHTAGHSLGVHLTRTTWGTVLLGPTARYQDDREDYESGRLPLEAFLEPARRLMPRLTLADLQPGGTGIRAKLCPPDRQFEDFMIRLDSNNPKIVQVAGIDSPGLTSSLAIGERAGVLVEEALG